MFRYVHRVGKPGSHHSRTRVAATITHTRTYTSRSRGGRAGKLVRELGGVTAGRGPSFCTSGGPVRAPTPHTAAVIYTSGWSLHLPARYCGEASLGHKRVQV